MAGVSFGCGCSVDYSILDTRPILGLTVCGKHAREPEIHAAFRTAWAALMHLDPDEMDTLELGP